MTCLECIVPVVTWIFRLSAVQSSLEIVAQRFCTFLTECCAGQVSTLVSSCSGDLEHVPVPPIDIVGAEETLAQIRPLLKNDSVGIIGIYGVGGIGKTALLRWIYDESGRPCGKFDIRIWVNVTKEVSIPEIHEQIARSLKLTLSNDVSQDARTLLQELSSRRVLMLLDDLWAKLDLDKVGIPVPTNKGNCKIAFTTRSLEVCSYMEAKGRVRVKLLDEGPSWELFCSQVGKVGKEVDLDKSPIRWLAKKVANNCGGLPLALITVATEMAERSHPEWELVVNALDHGAETIPGMDQVLCKLKLSFDYLKNEKMKSALLYCAMYPKGWEIERDELIEHWMGEGMLDDDVHGRRDDARRKGHDIITDLQNSCLLEAVIVKEEWKVRMHNCVRDLALWLNGSCDEVHGFITGEDLIKGAKKERLQHFRRIWAHGLPLDSMGAPPNSWTLLLNGSHHDPRRPLLGGIFNSMKTLRVLNLTEAHGLVELPNEIGNLGDLKYLNLRKTEIRSLPNELGKLVGLRQLDLGFTSCLCRIPREAIVGLTSLLVLDMRGSGYEWRAQVETPAMEVRMVDDKESKQHSSEITGAVEGSGGRQLELSDLEILERLKELGISLNSLGVHKKWEGQGEDDPLRMPFTKMGCCELHLDATHPWVGNLQISFDQFPRLERLDLSSNCQTTTTTTIVLKGTNTNFLSKLEVSGFNGLKWVGKFPRLKEIRLKECKGMKKLLLGDDNDGTGSQQHTRQEQLLPSRFPLLEGIFLSELSDLERLGWVGRLPKLEYISVRSCPKLRRLPLSPGSAPTLKEIEAEKKWWDALEWGSSGVDPNNKKIFTSFSGHCSSSDDYIYGQVVNSCNYAPFFIFSQSVKNRR